MKIHRITITALSALGLVVSATDANAADWQQPYGGCAEAWQAPHSEGAAECRDHGWIVRPRIVVGPHGWVKANRLPACIYEDGSTQHHCFWDADQRGIHQPNGMDYIADRPGDNGWVRLTYVKG